MRSRRVVLGANLARHDRLKVHPNVEILNASFAEAPRPVGAFDLVYAGSVARIAPAARFAKTHRLLKVSGHLAIIHRHYVSGAQGEAFTWVTQPIYRRWRAAARWGSGAGTHGRGEGLVDDRFAGQVWQH